MSILESPNDFQLYRRLLWVTGGIYFLWWFAVELLLRGAFNPVASRLLVVGLFVAVWGLSFVSSWVQRRLSLLFSAAIWLLTLHFFYLLLENQGSSEWVIGSFIAILATTYAFLSPFPLLAYSIYVALLSTALLFLLPSLRTSVFFPGILTILLQANVSLMARARIWRRLLEEQVKTQVMREKLETLDDFILLASHELKTPLTSLKLWAGLLERDLKKGETQTSPRAGETLNSIARQITRLTNLVETMLNVSQVSEKRLELMKQEVDLSILAKEAIALLRPESEILGCPITLVGSGPVLLKGDPLRLGQVLEGLLTNAMKFGNRRPIEVEVGEENESAVIKVKDNGIGIEAMNLPRIFDRFTRLTSSENYSGLGLGLFLTKRIVEAHGGTIEVSSTPDAGSVFTVRIPKPG